MVSKIIKDSFGIDFFTPKAKKTFIHLQKTFTKAPIFCHFDSESHIRIEIDTLGFAISKIFSQIISDQSFSNHVTYKRLDPNSSNSSKISKIDQID